MCLGHDCLVVYTTCKTGKGKKKFQNAGHFNTYIRCFPVDHNKTVGHTSFDEWNTYAQYVRDISHIPKLRCYKNYTTLQAVAALATLDNVCILRTERNNTLLTETMQELIAQLFVGMTKSIDTDLYQTLEATASLLQQVLLSDVELSTTAVEHIRSLIKEDPSCRLRLTKKTTNDVGTTYEDSNTTVDVPSTSILRKEAPSNNMRVTTTAIFGTNDNPNNAIVDDNLQTASSERSQTIWPKFDPKVVGLKRSLNMLGNTNPEQRLKEMRISDQPTSAVELPTNTELSGDIVTLTKQDGISPTSDIIEENIACIDGNNTTYLTNIVCAESAAKLYYKFTDEQWKALSSNQKKKVRKNMQRDMNKLVTNT